ncbi:MAG: class I SAM-dependent methyltransferase [Candidatus Levybacteria bacterium]|nr:class I SAM-dependent methyltransferase [Candidatus Levybacteria bacterium]
MNLLALFIPQSDSKREKWVAKELTKLPKNSTILDAGAGECQYKKYCQHLKYTSQDFNQYDGKGDKKGIQTGKRDFSKIDIVSDIVNMPIESGKFDSSLCIEVFEHLPRPLDALKELSRVTKKGGSLILTAPFASLTHYSPYFFYSGFSSNFYKENLPKYGFQIEKTYTYGNYFDFITLEIIRTPLVLWRMINILALPIFLIYPIVIPAYILMRLLSLILPRSSELLSFGICIKAKKL